MALTVKQILLMVGMLVTGTINTISKKVQLDCIAPGYPNRSANNTAIPHHFNKPWFQSLNMFMGEFICLIGFFIVRYRKRQSYESPYQQIGDTPASSTSDIGVPPRWHEISVFSWVFFLPTMCDVLGTSLAGVGLLYIDASIWQMMRGCIIIFAGILSMIFLKRRLKCFNWTGMFCTVVGLVLVGISSVFKKKDNMHHGGEAIFGILLVLAGGLASSAQMVIEEAFLKKRGFHPLQVVGMEGTIGCIIMAVGVLPAMYFIPGPDLNGSYENVLDAIYQISQNSTLLINVILYMLSIAFYNYFGLAVTQSLTAVHRTLIDALRTIFVWSVDLVLYYANSSHQFGEPFDKGFGLLQIDGFMFLLIGTLIYNKVADLSMLPCCAEEPDDMEHSRTDTLDDSPLDASVEFDPSRPLLAPAPPAHVSIQAEGGGRDIR